MTDQSDRSAVPPFALSLVICDQVYHETATGKYSLLGCFNTINAQRFPATHPSLAVYGSVTDIVDQARVHVRLVLVGGAGDDRVILDAPTPVEAPDRRAIAEFSLTLEDVTLPEPGDYRVQLCAGGHVLMEQRLYVREME